MATAGYLTPVYVTTTDTNPASGDAVGGLQSVNWPAANAELDTSVIGEAFATLIMGKYSNKPSLTVIYDSSDTGQGRFITAFGSRATVWIHYAHTGSTACKKLGVKVVSISPKSEQGGVVTAEISLAGTTAESTSTYS